MGDRHLQERYMSRLCRYCCVKTCSQNSRKIDERTGKPVRMHSFPDPVKDRERCQKWICNVKREDLNLDNVRHKKVCSTHFEPSCYNNPHDISSSCLMQSATPTIFQCRNSPKSKKSPPKSPQHWMPSIDDDGAPSLKRETEVSHPAESGKFDMEGTKTSENCDASNNIKEFEKISPTLSQLRTPLIGHDDAPAVKREIEFSSLAESCDYNLQAATKTSELDCDVFDQLRETLKSESSSPTPSQLGTLLILNDRVPDNNTLSTKRVDENADTATDSMLHPSTKKSESNQDISILRDLHLARIEIKSLKNECRNLNKKLKRSREKCLKFELIAARKPDKSALMDELLSKLPSVPKSLVKILLLQVKRVKDWSQEKEALNMCLSLHAQSPAAYRALRTCGFVLPHPKTLERKAKI